MLVEQDRGCTMESFSKAVSDGRGALLMAYRRGGMSESMDFRNRQARAVLGFEILFPPHKEADIELKRQFNDSRASSEGDSSYEAQAYRTLFQGVGRCIRHVMDHGAVVLIDERFQHEIASFPGWIRNGYAANTRTVPEIRKRLETFYADTSTRFPSEDQTTTCNYKAAFTLTCATCTGSLHPGARFAATQDERGHRDTGRWARSRTGRGVCRVRHALRCHRPGSSDRLIRHEAIRPQRR